MYDFLLLFVLTLILIYSFYVDINGKYKECIEKDKRILPIILFHRIFTLFIFTGWLFKNRIVLIAYVVITITMFLHWYTNSNKCFVTQIENKMCDFPKNTPYNPIYYYLSHLDTSVIDMILLLKITLFMIISVIKLLYFQ